MIRLYRNYNPNLSNCPVQMVSAFRGLNEVIQMRRGTGVITDWKQNGGTLMVGGDSRCVGRSFGEPDHGRILHCISRTVPQIPLSSQDLDTNSDSPVTAIQSDSGSSSMFLASFADGSIKIFDRRFEEHAVVWSYQQHVSWVQNVKWHPTIAGHFLSARYVSH